MKTIRQIDLEEVQLAFFFFPSLCMFEGAGAAFAAEAAAALGWLDRTQTRTWSQSHRRDLCWEKKIQLSRRLSALSAREGQILSVVRGHGVHHPSAASFSSHLPARSRSGERNLAQTLLIRANPRPFLLPYVSFLQQQACTRM